MRALFRCCNFRSIGILTGLSISAMLDQIGLIPEITSLSHVMTSLENKMPTMVLLPMERLNLERSMETVNGTTLS